MINKFLIYILLFTTPSIGLSITSPFGRIILVSGQSGSGKTALTEAFRNYLSKFNSIETLCLDHFYRDGALSVAFYKDPKFFLDNNRETIQKAIDLFLEELSHLGFPRLRSKYLPQYGEYPSWELADSYNWHLLKKFFEFMESNNEFHYPPYPYENTDYFKTISEPIIPADILIIEGLHTASVQMLETLASLDLITKEGKKTSILLLNVMTDSQTAYDRAFKRDFDQNRSAADSKESDTMDSQLYMMAHVLKVPQMEILSQYLFDLPSHISHFLEKTSPLKLQLLDFDNTKKHDFTKSLPQNLESALNEWMTK